MSNSKTTSKISCYGSRLITNFLPMNLYQIYAKLFARHCTKWHVFLTKEKSKMNNECLFLVKFDYFQRVWMFHNTSLPSLLNKL